MADGVEGGHREEQRQAALDGDMKNQIQHQEQTHGRAQQDHQRHGNDLGQQNLHRRQRRDQQLLDGAALFFVHGRSRGGQHDGQDGDDRQQFRDGHKPGVLLVRVVPDAVLVANHGHVLHRTLGDTQAGERLIETILADDLRGIAGGEKAQHGIAGVAADV